MQKKPAVCSKFRECTKAIGNIKSVSPLSPNGLIVFFLLVNEEVCLYFATNFLPFWI